jgi:hypothetical protein
MSIHKIADYIDVPLIHILAVGLTFTDIENYLKLISLILATGYTSWKWRSEYKSKKE